MTKQIQTVDEKLELLLRHFYSEMNDVNDDISMDTYDGTDFTYSDQHADWVNNCLEKYVRKIKLILAQAQLVKQDMPAVLPKNQCTQCGAWVSDELKDDHVCAAGEKKKTVFPEIIEGKDPDLIWRDGGTYVGVINRGDTIVMYTWDGIAESWITRNVFDRVDLFVKEF